MPPDIKSASTARAVTPDNKKLAERRWTPVYPVYPKGHPKKEQIISNSLPISWICPCTEEGTKLQGGMSCPKCGRVPLDHDNTLSGKQFAANTRDEARWRKFGRGRRV
jgi:hypothetical protein